jgi:hypothetical protein
VSLEGKIVILQHILKEKTFCAGDTDGTLIEYCTGTDSACLFAV